MPARSQRQSLLSMPPEMMRPSGRCWQEVTHLQGHTCRVCVGHGHSLLASLRKRCGASVHRGGRPWPQPVGQPSQAMLWGCPQRWPVHRCRLAALQLCGFDYLGAVGGAVARTCRLVLLTPKPSQPGIGTSPRCCLALHHLSAVLHCCWVYRSLNSVHPRQSMATPRHFSSCGGAAAEETRWWGTLQLSL